MKKILLAAAALAVAFPIAAANAGDAVTGAAAGVTGTASASASASGALGALGNSQMGIEAVGKADANTNIQVVTVTDADLSADAMSSHDADIKKLQAAIASQADLKAKLEAQSIDTSKVVAVGTAADGSLIVYTKS